MGVLSGREPNGAADRGDLIEPDGGDAQPPVVWNDPPMALNEMAEEAFTV
jgi:hypothetical protein